MENDAEHHELATVPFNEDSFPLTLSYYLLYIERLIVNLFVTIGSNTKEISHSKVNSVGE